MYPRKDELIRVLHLFLSKVLKPSDRERDALKMFPLVLEDAFGDVAISPEYGVDEGRIDFRIGGSNPILAELVVRTERSPNSLYGSQNDRELKKLSAEPPSRAKMRYLLLLDNHKVPMDTISLWGTYERMPRPIRCNPVCIIYAHREFYETFLWH